MAGLVCVIIMLVRRPARSIALPPIETASSAAEDVLDAPAETPPEPAVTPAPAPAAPASSPPLPAPGLPPRSELTTEEITARSEAAVALVHGKLSSGTAFLAAPGVIVTNAHVIEDEFLQNLSVRFPSAPEGERERSSLRLLFEDPKRDLALLAVNSSLKPLTLAPSYTFRRGQDVTTIGNPGIGGSMTLENAVSRGIMSTRTTIDGQAFYQLSIAINPGNSGGPVFDSTGQVIAVATLKAAQEEGLAFGIPVEAVNEAIAHVASQTEMEADRAASAHRFALILRLLCTSGDLYSVGLEQYCRAMTAAVNDHTSLEQNLAATVRVVTGKLSQLEQEVFSDLDDEVLSVTSDRFLPASMRQGVMEMWANISDMKRYLAHPPSDYQAFLAKALQMRTSHRNSVDRMKAAVDHNLAARLEPVNRPELALDLEVLPPSPQASAPTAQPAPAPVPLAMTLVDLSFDPERKSGFVKVRGKLKNTSPDAVKAIVATIQVHDKRGAPRLTRKVHVVPSTVEPGESGTFFTRIPLFSQQDHYKVDFATRAGQAITASHPRQP